MLWLLQSRPGKRARPENVDQTSVVTVEEVPNIGAEVTINEDVLCHGDEGTIVHHIPYVEEEFMFGEIEDESESQVSISVESARDMGAFLTPEEERDLRTYLEVRYTRIQYSRI